MKRHSKPTTEKTVCLKSHDCVFVFRCVVEIVSIFTFLSADQFNSSDGGLKMTDFNIMNKALKVAWIPRLQTNTDVSWKTIPELALEHHGGLSFLTHYDYDINLLKLNRLPSFYHEVLKHYTTK